MTTIDLRRPTATVAADALAAHLARELSADGRAVRAIVRADRPRPGSRPDRTTLLPAIVAGLALDEAVVVAAFDRVEAACEADQRARILGLPALVRQRSGIAA